MTGDKAACEEAVALLGDVETVAVKEGSGRFAAYCPHPQHNRRRIREAAERAIRNHHRFQPLKAASPVALTLDLFTQQQAMIVNLVPGAERLSPRTIRFTVDDFNEGMKVFCLCGYLCAGSVDCQY